MNRDQIIAKWSAMTPRERDAWVAEVVLGYEVYGGFYVMNEVRVFYPFYTTDISAAWTVVEKMRETHVYQLDDFGRNAHKATEHFVLFHPLTCGSLYRDEGVRQPNAPEAICLAALIATQVNATITKEERA